MVFGIALTIVVDTLVQIAWKHALDGIPASASFVEVARTVAVNPVFYLAMLAFAAQLFIWLRLLAESDLSFAQPLTAVSYISVLAISHHSLDETISRSKLTGVALIFIGIYFITRTPHRTSAPAVKAIEGTPS